MQHEGQKVNDFSQEVAGLCVEYSQNESGATICLPHIKTLLRPGAPLPSFKAKHEAAWVGHAAQH